MNSSFLGTLRFNYIAQGSTSLFDQSDSPERPHQFSDLRPFVEHFTHDLLEQETMIADTSKKRRDYVARHCLRLSSSGSGCWKDRRHEL